MQVGKIGETKLLLNNYFLLVLVFWSFLDLLSQALIVFGLVLWHELAHTLWAKKKGLRVKNIEILPFGGVARLEGLMELDPLAEIEIAFAGPLSNIFLGTFAWLLKAQGIIEGDLALFFIQGNFLLAFFNLLPAFPLDGGRIYRAFLTTRLGYCQATEKAADLGKILAVVLLALGLGGIYLRLDTYPLIILGPFIYWSASLEKEMAGYAFICHLSRKKDSLKKAGVLSSEELVALEEIKAREIIKYFLPQKYHLVYVLNDKMELEGIVTETQIIQCLMEQGRNYSLKELLKQHL